MSSTVSRTCKVFVSPKEGSAGGWSTDGCLECGTQWMQHKNIGPGWRERSEAQKVQLGLLPHIELGEN